MTASDLPTIYRDGARTGEASEQDLTEMVGRLLSAKVTANYQVIGDRAYSAADQFEVLTAAIGSLIEGKKLRFPIRIEGLLGPDGAPPAAQELERLRWPAFRDAVLDVRDYIKTERRVPARVFIGPDAVPPVDFLAGLAAAYEHYRKNGVLPLQEGVTLGKNVELLPIRYIAKDTPGLFGGWVIHKEGFRAPKILEVARQQAWTLKPAIRKE
ncbi:MAG: hypothetical protein DME26_18070 [Verrucomicrobia bacterium]|nr:MAG: hypothetical protein DME26_18070 [Verrucomicrobiota bacterium]